jgi:hypothetical protein
MSPSQHLVIVQRYQPTVFKTLRHAYRGAADVIFDRRHGERRVGGVYPGLERRQQERRRALSADERALWSELSHLVRSAG